MQSVPAPRNARKLKKKNEIIGGKNPTHRKKTQQVNGQEMLPERRIILNTCLLPGAYFARAKSGQQKGNKSKERTGRRGEVNYLKMERKK